MKEVYNAGMLQDQWPDAVAFLISRCEESLKFPYISIARTRHRSMFLGRSKCPPGFPTTLHLCDLRQFAEFELSS